MTCLISEAEESSEEVVRSRSISSWVDSEPSSSRSPAQSVQVTRRVEAGSNEDARSNSVGRNHTAYPTHARAPSSTARAVPSATRRLVSTDTLDRRSEEHTSELQSLMRISYAVFCLKKKKLQ